MSTFHFQYKTRLAEEKTNRHRTRAGMKCQANTSTETKADTLRLGAATRRGHTLAWMASTGWAKDASSLYDERPCRRASCGAVCIGRREVLGSMAILFTI